MKALIIRPMMKTARAMAETSRPIRKVSGVACCPYCGSTSIFITYGKMDGRVRHCTCISCGKVFQPGQKP